MRVSEVEYITVEAVHRGVAVVSCKGKTRRVFIVSALRKKLLQYANKQGICREQISGENEIEFCCRKNCKIIIANLSTRRVENKNSTQLFAKVVEKTAKHTLRIIRISAN